MDPSNELPPGGGDAPEAALPAPDLAALLEDAPEAVVVYDPATRFAFVNGRAERLFGRRREELIGRAVADVFPMAVDGPIQARLFRALRDQHSDTFEDRSAFLGRVLEVHCRPLAGSLAIWIRDVTEERAAEAERTFFAAAVATSPDAVIGMSRDEALVTHWNAGAEELYGWRADEILGLPSSLLVPDERLPEFNTYRDRINAGLETSVLLETVRRRKDGSLVDVSVRVSAVFDPDDNGIIGMCAVARDVTERRRSEERIAALNRDLTRRAHEFEAILELNPIALMIGGDPECRTIRGNPAALRLMRAESRESNLSKGAPEDERPPYRVLRGGAEPPVEDLPMQRAARTGQEVTGEELEVVYPDGTTTQILSYAVPLFDEQTGQTRGALGAFLDVTENRRLLARQTRVAEALQRSLLVTPEVGAFPGVEVFPFYDAASEEALLGGDFFDVFALDGGRVALVIGDFTGKGLRAATETAEVKFALRAFLREDPAPGIALGRLNRHLFESRRLDNKPDTTLLGCVACVLDPATGGVRCAAAGMEPPLVVRADSGAAEEVPARGLLVGAEPAAGYAPAMATLLPGDVLAIATDGVTEARRDRRSFFGLEGMAEAVRHALQAGAPDLPAVSREVVSAARAFAGGPLGDDVCLLLARIPTQKQ